MSKSRLTHVDDRGQARMVEVTDKADTRREAVARGFVRMSPEVIDLIRKQELKKGDPLPVARVAGIMAAKRTHDLIPLCHPLPLTSVTIDLEIREDGIDIESRVVCVGKTGVEMEALTAVTVAALTLYDMCKAVDKRMVIESVMLVKKSGGRSGVFVRSDSD